MRVTRALLIEELKTQHERGNRCLDIATRALNYAEEQRDRAVQLERKFEAIKAIIEGNATIEDEDPNEDPDEDEDEEDEDEDDVDEDWDEDEDEDEEVEE